MSFFVAGCVLFLALLVGILIDDAIIRRGRGKWPSIRPFDES
jgi:hypothetical protein